MTLMICLFKQVFYCDVLDFFFIKMTPEEITNIENAFDDFFKTIQKELSVVANKLEKAHFYLVIIYNDKKYDRS